MSDELIPVVQYVRMSTELQRYSIANQRAAIEAYAVRHGMHIVETFEDHGKSGLHLDSRVSLRRLLEIVQSGHTNFKAILVYDVSRWGRFQNPDESAHYEHLCNLAGIKIIFCAEPFENDGSPLMAIVKSVKRSMAAEYSRDLSTKVFAGACRLAKMGFRQGGPPGYGLKRVLLDEGGRYKADLALGERKSLLTDRVVLAPGPPEEVKVVRRIYRDFIEKRMSERAIADALNKDGLSFAPGRPWTRWTIQKMLVSEKYVGRNVYSRTSSKLTKKTTYNPPTLWVRCEEAFAPIISTDVFEKAQALVRHQAKRFSDEVMIEKLQALYVKHGYLSSALIRAQREMPSCSSYKDRFGSLMSAYAFVGFDANGFYDYVHVDRAVNERYGAFLAELEKLVLARGGVVSVDLGLRRLVVNGQWTAQVEILRSRPVGRHFEWRYGPKLPIDVDVVLLARMDHRNRHFYDYFIVPVIDLASIPEWLKEDNEGMADTYRFQSPDVFGDLAAQDSLRAFHED